MAYITSDYDHSFAISQYHPIENNIFGPYQMSNSKLKMFIFDNRNYHKLINNSFLCNLYIKGSLCH